MHSWKRNQAAITAAAFVGFTGFTLVMPFLPLYFEELGLTEADLAFEDLQDPYGIQFWPDFKGRDGCRTPIPWTSEKPNAGFTTGKPWLPVAEPHIAVAASVQESDPYMHRLQR